MKGFQGSAPAVETGLGRNRLLSGGPIYWHVLDAGSIWLKEFAAALGTMVPTRNWSPVIRHFGHWETWQRIEELKDPAVRLIHFPLQRGYARFPVNYLLPSQKPLLRHLLRDAPNPDDSTLIVTTPFYAPVAELWPGRVVYYQTDLTKEYAGLDREQVVDLDRRLCRLAHAVCPNSRRIAAYFVHEAGCNPEKITVIPNATRAANVLDGPLLAPAALPSDLADLPRPVVGVIGNLAGNLDWLMLRDAVNRAPQVSWAFIGPSSMEIPDTRHRQARQELLCIGGRVRFVGPRPYGQLRDYARAFDAALIPYLKCEPTYSGSATRFYEHLAASRPIVASRGHAELLTKEPLLKLVGNGEELADHLAMLGAQGFSDGYEELRWKTSFEETWEARAEALLAAPANLAARAKLFQRIESRNADTVASL